ncbi:MAG: hypothetical protein SOU19_00500 [Candidatus Caccosoma sp.]|nr:hypothetical protein [Candidatus Caccosoma sp.]
MQSKGLKVVGYTFFISIIVLFVLRSQGGEQNWLKIVTYICLGLMALCLLIILGLFIFCMIDNKNVDKLLKTDDYDNLISYCNKKANKKWIFLSDRKSYYEYLLLLAYIGKDDENKFVEYFNKFDDVLASMFPLVFYWKASYEFSINKYDNIKNYSQSFKDNLRVKKSITKYQSLFEILDCYNLYIDGKVTEAKELLNKIDMSSISMAITKRALAYIKDN